MARSAYPLAEDVQLCIAGAGLVSSLPSDSAGAIDYDSAINWAVRRFEERTGRIPFLGDSNDVTMYFNPPGPDTNDIGAHTFGYRGGSRILQLDCGLISLTSLSVGYTLDNPGTPLTRQRDFDLYPLNAAIQNKPWEWIEFRVRQWGPPGSIKIVGKRGFVPGGTIPDDAWEAIKQGAAARLIPQVQAAITGGLVEWSESDVKEKYGDNPFGTFTDRCNATFYSAIDDYRLVTL